MLGKGMFAPPPLPRTLPASFRDLTSERPEIRASAVGDLARHAQPDAAIRAQALPCLERALREDEHGQVRAAAAVALADLGAFEALPSLLLAVEDPDLHVRQMALNGLGEIGDPRAAPRVERALEHPRPEVRYQALIAFAKLAPEPRDAAAALTRALDDDDPAIRYIAVRLLEERVAPLSALEPPLLAKLQEFARGEAGAAANHEVSLAAAILLAKLGDLTGKARLLEVVRGAFAAASSRAKEDEQEAVELVGQLGLREAVPALERRAYGVGRWVRDTCTFHARIALARLGHPRAVREINVELDSPREAVRAGAVVAAGRACLLETKPLIERLLEGQRVDPHLAAEALRALTGRAP